VGALVESGQNAHSWDAAEWHDADNPELGTDAQLESAGATLLHRAAGQGDRAQMKTFLSTFEVDCVDHLGRTPMMYACINNKTKAVELLIKQAANLILCDSTGRTALFLAAYYGHHDVVKILLKVDASLANACDPEGRTALHWSTKHTSIKCLEALVKVGSREAVNKQDNELVTALHWAVLCRSHEHATRLIKAGASTRLADSEGRTPLHYAVCNDAQNTLRSLLECRDAGEVINAKDVRGRTALHLAINSPAALECVQQLLDCESVDVNCTDASMRTPLHWAAVCNSPAVCEALANRGGDIEYRDMSGRTATHYASEKVFLHFAFVSSRLHLASCQPISSLTHAGPSRRAPCMCVALPPSHMLLLRRPGCDHCRATTRRLLCCRRLRPTTTSEDWSRAGWPEGAA